ncbi:IMP 5'-nucleotidase [Borealophlyctis nickersoniae]|nr:IMP 5'-nucleotidase [Borealophlyctis nickersoniae]
MTSLYSTNYHLRAHKRDGFIEFIKSLLLTPFVLHTRPRSTRKVLESDGEGMSTEDTSSGTSKRVDYLRRLDRVLSDGSIGWFDRDSNGDQIDGAGSPTATVREKDRNVQRYCEILMCVEDLIVDAILHQQKDLPELSRLSTLVPTIGRFFTPLPLKDAFLIQNAKRSIAARRFVPPSFNDIRHILNAAQVMAIAPTLKLITLYAYIFALHNDGDCTLYADGADFAQDSQLVTLLVRLLRHNLTVAIVTAAGYPGDASRYEQRLSGLLDGFRASQLSKEQLERFFVLGGECNYLFRYDFSTQHLVYIKPDEYKSFAANGTTYADRIADLLDVAQETLEECADVMGLKENVQIIRKDRGLGVVPNQGTRLSREQLDEFALSAQRRLNNHQHAMSVRRKRIPSSSDEPWAPLPFCAFNGGQDVWVDIGNKLIGVSILREHVGAEGNETLHVGDQFLSTGNDYSTRSACCTVWITNPEETAEVLIELDALLVKGH